MYTNYTANNLVPSMESYNSSQNGAANEATSASAFFTPFQKLAPKQEKVEVIQKKTIENANTKLDKEQRKSFIKKFTADFDNIRFLIRYQFSFYMRHENAYIAFDNSMFLNIIYQVGMSAGIELSPAECNEISLSVQLHTPNYPGELNEETYTLFQNGYVDNCTGKFYANIGNYFPTIYVTGNFITYRPLHHPIMDNYLAGLFENSTSIDRAWEIIGYCLSSDAKAKRFFVFPGASGDNGKSTFVELLSSLLSTNAVSNLSMKNLLGGRFALSELNFKRLNISSDEGYLSLDNDQLGVLKRISGHDYITADVKCKDQVTFRSTCKVIIASNHNVGLSYTASDSAVMRRICTLPFNRKIPREQQNPNIIRELMSEKDDIVTEAMGYYWRLRAKNYVFTGDEEGYDDYATSALYNDQYSSLLQFCEKYCDYSNVEAFTYTEDLYNIFRTCYGDMFSDITAFSQAFYKANERMFRNLVKIKCHTADRNAWGFKGIAIK